MMMVDDDVIMIDDGGGGGAGGGNESWETVIAVLKEIMVAMLRAVGVVVDGGEDAKKNVVALPKNPAYEVIALKQTSGGE